MPRKMPQGNEQSPALIRPHPGWLPFGWYLVPPSDGRVVGFVAFNNRWVTLGEPPAVVTSAWCPHDGAPLLPGDSAQPDRAQHASCAVDELPRCPRCGQSVEATLPTECWAGRTWMWWHPHNVPPLWAMPSEITDFDLTHLEWMSIPVTTTWMDIAENSSDWAHFPALHAPAVMPTVLEDRWIGHVRTIRSLQRGPAPGGDTLTEVAATAFGPGVLVSHSTVADLMAVLVINSIVPVDDRRVAFHYAVATRSLRDDPIVPGVVRRTRRDLVRAIERQMAQDKSVWDHKLWLSRPQLADNEGAILQLRRDLERFRADSPASLEHMMQS